MSKFFMRLHNKVTLHFFFLFAICFMVTTSACSSESIKQDASDEMPDGVTQASPEYKGQEGAAVPQPSDGTPPSQVKRDEPKVIIEEVVVSDEAETEAAVVVESQEVETVGEKAEILLSTDYVRLVWEASSRKDLEAIDELVNACLNLYDEEAKKLQSQLSAFPERSVVKTYQVLNDVGTCLFVQAEAYMNTGKTQKSIDLFENLIEYYPWAQAWDPRGWHWSVKEKSQASIDVLTGKAQEEIDKQFEKVIRTKPQLYAVGKKKVIDYSKYGEFKNVGTAEYQYILNDNVSLAKATGEGIYPNTASVYNNPRRKIVQKEGRMKGSHWDFTNSDDLEAAYFKWVKAPEPWGVRLFYLGMIFEKAGLYYEALKAYHALVVHFPKTTAWTYWQTPWYPGQAAIAKIKYIIRTYPQLKLKAQWMKIEVKNGYDNDVSNDEFIVYPGKIVEKTWLDRSKEAMGIEDKVALKKIVRRVGEGDVRLVRYDNAHWQLLVKDKPYIIKGLTYDPTKIGQSPDKGTLANWMEEDSNGNGKPDGPYDSWVDANRNNKQDANEPVVGDFQLMKEMGVNTIRFYHVPTTPDKEVLLDLYNNYGIRVILGDFLGKYTVGSGATWFEGTDYENEEHKKNMMESVQKMVLENKDEPYILFWLLGNENNYGVACNADKKPEAYFKFVDEVAQWIKSVDPNHPVAVCNGDALFLDVFAKHAPNVDIFSANVYRGDYGFGAFWEQVAQAADKPAFITEYGCPAFAGHLSLEEAEEAQALYHRGNWMDIQENLAGSAKGMGNALGGVTFEWIDEWWKNYEPYLHDRKSDAIGPFPGGYYFEEWFGLVTQGDGSQSPFLRQLRPSYRTYQELWN